MILPTLEQLQHVTSLLWREDFIALDDMRKLKVIEIAQRGIQAELLDGIAVEIGIQVAEQLATVNTKQWFDVADGIENRLGHIANWFEKSRLYQP